MLTFSLSFSLSFAVNSLDKFEIVFKATKDKEDNEDKGGQEETTRDKGRQGESSQ